MTASLQEVFAQDPCYLTNSQLQLRLHPQHGALIELGDPVSRHNFIGSPSPQTALWELELLIDNAPRLLSPTNARSFRANRNSRSSLRLTWTDFNVPSMPKLAVQVEVTLDERQPVSYWQIRADHLASAIVRQARFPRVIPLRPQPEERLAIPMWMGQETDQPREIFSKAGTQGHRQEWSYPGLLSLQCLAYYRRQGPGLYLSADDTAAFAKNFAVFGDGEGNLACEIVHLPERVEDAASSWKLPYQVTLGTFIGDWVTAAERYRAWATNQVWARESRLARRQVPSWVADTALWVWNRGRSPQVLDPALALHKELNLPVSVFWHWWHGCAYDAGFPEYLPPREGAESFRRAVAEAKQEGLGALVYMNQRLWGMTTESWAAENAEKHAVKEADGKVRPEVYNTFTKQPCASMCLGTDFWRRKYAGLAEQAVADLGVSGIYMDQACSSLACYDPAHGHPRGGGTYWMQGFQKLAGDIRRRCVQREVPVPALAGEGCGESWLPYLDLMLSLQVSKERYAGPDGWETIPFFHAVYHPYTVLYGNYSSLTMPPYDDLWPAEFAPAEPLKLLDRKFSRQFYLEQARAFVWGQQPTIANFLPSHLRERSEEIQYVLRLAKLRSRALKYLRDGTFLRAPAIEAPSALVPISRLSIYAGQRGGLTEFQKSMPLALAAAWRAADGGVGIALASIADETQDLTFQVDPEYYRVPRSVAPIILDDSGRRPLSNAERGNPLTIKMPPRGACIVEFEPK